DGDHRLLDDRLNLRRSDDHPVLPADDPELAAEVIEHDRALRVLELREPGERGQVGGDRDEYAEHERHEAEQQRGEEDRDQAQPLQARFGCERAVGAIVLAHRRLAAGPLLARRALRARWRGPRGGARWGPPGGESLALAAMLSATDAA